MQSKTAGIDVGRVAGARVQGPPGLWLEQSMGFCYHNLCIMHSGMCVLVQTVTAE